MLEKKEDQELLKTIIQEIVSEVTLKVFKRVIEEQAKEPNRPLAQVIPLLQKEIEKKPRIRKDVADSGSLVWLSYSNAIERKYKSKPTRSNKTNSIIKQIIERVGQETAIKLVDFYVSHDDQWYVKKAHDISYCLSDIHKISIEFNKGIKITNEMARKADKAQEIDQTVNYYLNKTKDNLFDDFG